MGLFAIIIIAVAGWLLWTGRLQRMTAKDGMALGIAIVGAVMAAKGKPLLGALPLIASTAFFFWRSTSGKPGRKPSGKKATAIEPGDVVHARALLGLPADSDEQMIRNAHRRLIASVHPDRGGTEALAAQINAARDLLLRYQADRNRSRPD